MMVDGGRQEPPAVTSLVMLPCLPQSLPIEAARDAVSFSGLVIVGCNMDMAAGMELRLCPPTIASEGLHTRMRDTTIHYVLEKQRFLPK